MIGRFMERLFGGSNGASGGHAGASEEYLGFDIQATPVNEANGWRVSGIISKSVDGVDKTYRFERADTCMDADSASEMTLRKARQLIDERGETLFD